MCGRVAEWRSGTILERCSDCGNVPTGQKEQSGGSCSRPGMTWLGPDASLGSGEQRPDSQPELFHFCALAHAVPFTCMPFLLYWCWNTYFFFFFFN